MREGEGEDECRQDECEIRVSPFDYSVENHVTAIETISKLCREMETDSLELTEIQRLYPSITFLREWKHFNYVPRTVRFEIEVESSQQKGFLGEVNLPQFSSAAVPKEGAFGGIASPESSKDFVMHVGGSVWALDWCPRAHEMSASPVKCEFLAVAAHPPNSYYHKIGALLTGRGVVQIWCILNDSTIEEDALPPLKKSKRKTKCDDANDDKLALIKKPRGRPQKKQAEESCIGETTKGSTELKRPRGRPRKHKEEIMNDEANKYKKPRGRPRKKTVNDSTDSLEWHNQHPPALAIEYPEDPAQILAIEVALVNPPAETVQENKTKKQKSIAKALPTFISATESTGEGRKLKSKSRVGGKCAAITCPSSLAQNEDQSSITNNQISNNCFEEPAVLKCGLDKKPRGRPRKKTVNDSNDSLECHNQHPLALAVEYPEDPAQILAIEVALVNPPAETVQENKTKKQKSIAKALPTFISATESTGEGRKLKSKSKVGGKCAAITFPSSLAQNEYQSSITNNQISNNRFEEPAVLKCDLDNVSFDINSNSRAIPENIVLPRLVFCLAHNGKVVWDVKWRPHHMSDPKNMHQMGYLAVLLGNGSLEVWDVPLPTVTNAIYASSHREGTDPRFVKLEPVFKCSIARGGEIESIPLTVEWSALCPHDYLLAGCHDGKVALWKFSADTTSGDTRPLLCFSADTVPIRALAWAPSESDQESANIVLTAGHGGLKFWDIRDPFRPLWDIHPAPKFIYSVDWLPDPRCIILSFDDGTIRLLSLVKAAYDAHVCGRPSVGPKQLGMHVLTCPSFAIWSVQVSRKTGMVAYCNADGTVCRFQLTTKAVEKDPSRNRVPHFKIWSLGNDASAITVCTSLPDTPLSLKKPVNNVGDSSRTMRSLFESSQTKAASKEKALAADNQPLAICYGNERRASGSDETLGHLRKQTILKSKTASKELREEDLSLACINEEQSKTTSKELTEEDLSLACINEERNIPRNESSNEFKIIPPKIVAMHRVRWNPNQGSERWLSCGGAAGIVRCQEILLSDLDKKLARKR